VRPLRNPKHEAFCQYYVFGHPPLNGRPSDWRERPTKNGQRSYEAAGYESTGPVARAASSRLLRREDIQLRIEELEQTRRTS